MRKFESLINQYFVEEAGYLDTLKSDLAKGVERTLHDVLTIAKKMDSKYMYWPELEQFIHDDGGISLVLEWYDLLFEATEGKFLTAKRKKLLFKNLGIDSIRMVAERYNLTDWDYNKEWLRYNEQS
jgi:hypothetical protein